MIHVIATVELRPDRRARFLQEFAAVAPLVRAEAGCVEYGAALDVASGLKAQIPLRAATVTIIERWTSLQALGAHAVAPHMVAFRQRVADFVLGTSLQVLAPSDG
jgi:quinol monooxygenase YgiN